MKYNTCLGNLLMKDFWLLMILILYFVLRIIFFTPVFSDETIYINMAKAVSNGLRPYKDFFYAHPPIQLFLLAPFALFENFFLVKMIISIIGILCTLLTYSLAKKIFGQEAAIATFIFFLTFPGFLIFGNLAMGTFEALLFFLLSFNFIVRKKPILASISLTLSLFTRYLVVFLFPFLLFYTFKYYRKMFKYFIVSFTFFSFLTFTFFYSIFGKEFLSYTFFYHLFFNIHFLDTNKSGEQYFTLGFYTIFASLTSLAYALLIKKLKIAFFASYPLFHDALIFLILKRPIYHYFTFSLPLVFIALGVTFSKSKSNAIKIFIITILLLSIFSNLKSLNVYFNKEKNLILQKLSEYTLENTNPSDLIFGSAIPTNFVSFTTGRKIANNYFDSDPKFVNFVGKEKLVQEIERVKPKFVFADCFYLALFKDNYEITEEWSEPEYYRLFLMKRKD